MMKSGKSYKMVEKFSLKFSSGNNFKELSSEEELTLEKNLVWIFADRRSGTTWLGQELLSYNTKFMDEPLIGLHLGRLDPHKGGFILTTELQKDHEDYFFSEKYKDVWKYYLRKFILNRIYSQFHDLTHKIILKEPTGSTGAKIISDCLPNSKSITILRDGRDVLDSKMDAFRKDGWGTKKLGFPTLSKEERLSFIKTRAKQWVALIEILLKNHNERSEEVEFMIRYEELLEKTSEILKKLYQFIEIEISDEKINELVEKYSFKNIPEKDKGEGKFRRFATPGKWKENFDDDEKKVIDSIMGETLKKIDYQ